jgi:3-methyl-2-oxobutanoate hydroxymethyltransferase
MEVLMQTKKTVHYLMEKKRKGVKITRTVVYDYPMAVLAEAAGIDVINVGDSIGMVILGEDTTIKVKLDFLIIHAKAVRKGAPTAFIMGDMPFLSYQVSIEESIRNAGRYLQEAEVDAVKVEGGFNVVETVKALTAASIPVVGHVGLTPQSAASLGGFRTQGRDAETAFKIVKEVEALEKAGAIMILVEAVPAEVTKIITERSFVPILGTGSGPYSDSPSINPYDMLGFYQGKVPKFVKQYANISEIILDAFKRYIKDVETGAFPDERFSYKMAEGEYEKFLNSLQKGGRP